MLGLVLLVIAPRARADEAQELELGKNRFDAGQYEDAVKRFTTMLDPSVAPCEKSAPKKSGRCRLTDKQLIERARAFLAASLVALGRVADADVHIETLLRANPGYAPNPALFPSEVIDRFTEVRARIRAELEAITRKEDDAALQKRLTEQKAEADEKRWLDEIQRLASEERVVRTNSRFLATLPFGVGQFQNGQSGLGWFFLVSEAALGAATIASAAVHSYNISIDPKATDASGQKEVDVEIVNSAIQISATLNQIAFGTWAALTVAGIIHAHATFVPETSKVVKRPIPKRPVKPTVSGSVTMAPGGAGVMVVGTF
jgi:hypothetical protein